MGCYIINEVIEHSINFHYTVLCFLGFGDYHLAICAKLIDACWEQSVCPILIDISAGGYCALAACCCIVVIAVNLNKACMGWNAIDCID